MNKGPVLVDSSAWVPYLASAREPTHPLRLLGQKDRLATNGLIRVELLSGATNEAEYAALATELQHLWQLAMNDEVWAYAARLRWMLCRKGFTLPVVDVVIASTAIVHDCKLLHADRHFDLIARNAPLKIYKAKPVKAR